MTTKPAPTPAGYETANSCEIPFPCREHAEQEAAHLNENIPTRKHAAKQIGNAWYCCQIAWRSPLIGADGKAYHIEA